MVIHTPQVGVPVMFSLLCTLCLCACAPQSTGNNPTAQSLTPASPSSVTSPVATPAASAPPSKVKSTQPFNQKSTIAPAASPTNPAIAQAQPTSKANSKANSKGNSMSSTTSNLTLTQADSGKTIVLKQGQLLILHLDENPTTGYRWSLPQLDGKVLQLSKDQFNPASGGAMGAGGQRILTFQAGTPGQVTLALKNQREWERNSDGIAQFNLTLKIVEE
jgi:inhibitor of cysteine peptidase